jgi:uncharacterized protein YrzB (UPF0473 family)
LKQQRKKITEYLIIERAGGESDKYKVLARFSLPERTNRYIVLVKEEAKVVSVYRCKEDMKSLSLEKIDDQDEWKQVEKELDSILAQLE